MKDSNRQREREEILTKLFNTFNNNFNMMGIKGVNLYGNYEYEKVVWSTSRVIERPRDQIEIDKSGNVCYTYKIHSGI